MKLYSNSVRKLKITEEAKKNVSWAQKALCGLAQTITKPWWEESTKAQTDGGDEILVTDVVATKSDKDIHDRVSGRWQLDLVCGTFAVSFLKSALLKSAPAFSVYLLLEHQIPKASETTWPLLRILFVYRQICFFGQSISCLRFFLQRDTRRLWYAIEHLSGVGTSFPYYLMVDVIVSSCDGKLLPSQLEHGYDPSNGSRPFPPVSLVAFKECWCCTDERGRSNYQGKSCR